MASASSRYACTPIEPLLPPVPVMAAIRSIQIIVGLFAIELPPSAEALADQIGFT